MSPTQEIITSAPAAAEEWLSRFAEIDARDNADNPADHTPQWMTTEALLLDPREADRMNDAIAYLEALSQMTAQEIARQQARQRAIDEASYQLQRACLNAMEAASQTTIHGQRCTLRKRLNPPSVRIEDPALIPAEFKRTPPPPPAVPDKTAIRAAIESGTYVPGAALVRGSRLERK
jgi:hypothetical protein